MQLNAKHPTMPMRCRSRECGKRFSAKTGTVMQSSKLGYQKWVLAMYLLSTSPKSVSSVKLAKDLNITQKSAWHLAHRIRQAEVSEIDKFEGPVEVDETFMGGLRKNMHYDKKKELRELYGSRGLADKTPVMGIKDRATNKIAIRAIRRVNAPTAEEFIDEHTKPGAVVYTDDSHVYWGLGSRYEHNTVVHSAFQYVDGDAHTNGIEGGFAPIKRAFKGIFHKMSPKHLQRYAQESAFIHNTRDMGILDKMELVAAQLVGRRLKYRDLIARTGWASGARATAV